MLFIYAFAEADSIDLVLSVSLKISLSPFEFNETSNKSLFFIASNIFLYKRAFDSSAILSAPNGPDLEVV